MLLNARLRSAALFAVLLATPFVARAQITPSAEEIFAKHVAAVGGKEAVLKLTSIKSSGTLEMPSMGISAAMESAGAPNRSVMKVTIPGIGEIANGFDGAVAWEINPMKGPRIKNEKERISAQEDADFHSSMLFAPSRYQSAECVGALEFGGERTWHVKSVLKSGRVVNEYFSVATGLRVGMQTTQDSQAGSVAVSTVESNYKQFGALKFATRNEMTTGPQKVVVTITEVVLSEVPTSTFTLPDPVKALVKP